METRTIGSLTVSVVGLGCSKLGTVLDEDRTGAVVRAALAAGVTLFDTADVYGGARSEVLLGQALGAARDEVVIATKFGFRGGHRPEEVREACDASLARLGTDRIDLYQVHLPNDAVPIEDTLGAMADLVTAGKVREIGCSNFDSLRVDRAATACAARGWPAFVSIQNRLSLLDQGQLEDATTSCEHHDLRLLPYFPLASGMLTGKYRRGEPPPAGSELARMPEPRRAELLSERSFDVTEALAAFAAAHGRTLLELAISWLACLPITGSIIAGATSPEQVRANVAAASWRLSPDEMAEVSQITRG